MKRKSFWILIGVSSGLIVILILMLFLNIILKISWWWFFGTLIIELVGSALFGLGYFIWKISKSEPIKTRMDAKTAEEKAIKEIMFDEHNPDNFKIERRIFVNVGDPQHDRTQILHLQGYGTELGTRIDVIINLEKPKLEMSRLDAATDTEIKRIIRGMAEHPENEIIDKTTTAYDFLGRPTMTQEIRKVSNAKKEAEEDKKEADLKNTY